MVPKYQTLESTNESAFSDYERFLQWVTKTLNNNGWFISRCLTFPDGYPTSNLSKSVQEKTESVIHQLGHLADGVDRDKILIRLDEQMIDQPPPEGAKLTLVGIDADKIFEKLYQTNFSTVHLIKVRNLQSGYQHLNFMCKI
jgi:hypothetical protein